MKQSVLLLGAAALPAAAIAAGGASASSQLPKPNIVWFMTEDLSPQYMSLYNSGKGGETPNLEALSKESILFNNAFSNAPVSSAARSTLITGCYAPRIGASLHRKIVQKEMPEGLNMFPSYLRKAGYFTVNASKTDYNVVLDETAWDQIKGKIGDWNNRKDKDQPFFYVRTNTLTHESTLLFNQEYYDNNKTVTSPSSVHIHPNLPDTELMRYTYAKFYDAMYNSDKEFGQIVEKLRKEGLMDNTFIFYFGDNGGSLPGSKGYTNDTGLRVPLVVYVPKPWREVLGVEVGKSDDGFVSFMDLGPTVLALAGVEIPEQMDGAPVLGGSKGVEGREKIVCYGDRFDELYAMNRVLYRDNFRYMRNYQPYQMQGLFSIYRYKSLAMREWAEMFKAGKLNENQKYFFEPVGAEKLFDLEADPNELNNLANDPRYAKVLVSMRKELASYVDNHCDLGLLPETLIHEDAIANPATWGDNHKKELAGYNAIANLQMSSFDKAEKSLIAALKSDDKVSKWWALTTAALFGKQVKGSELVELAKQIVSSSERTFVKSRAYVMLALSGETKIGAKEIKAAVGSAMTISEALESLNDFAFLRQTGLIAPFKFGENDIQFSSKDISNRVEFLGME